MSDLPFQEPDMLDTTKLYFQTCIDELLSEIDMKEGRISDLELYGWGMEDAINAAIDENSGLDVGIRDYLRRAWADLMTELNKEWPTDDDTRAGS
jgi:hypothetical protein